MKISLTLNLILAALVAIMGYLFIIKGSAFEADDGRTAILLSVGERDHVLGEMRGLLEAVQGITEAIVADDMVRVSEEASAVGMVLALSEDPTMIAKLPLEFKTDGFAAHAAFDSLSETASTTNDGAVVLKELSVILSACTACHAGYRLAVETE